MKKNQVGIIGGGQLALMLADAALKMGLKPIILAEDSYAPAARAHNDVIFGSAKNERDLHCLFSQVDRVIFENEFINCSQLAQVASGLKTQFFPSLNAISLLQDKLQQKELLLRNQIPTAEFLIFNPDQSIRSQLESHLKELKGKGVLKWARMGYDGKGVFILDDSSFQHFSEIETFFENAQKQKSPVFIERKIQYKRELAVVAVRSIHGDFLSYPLVISEQKRGICHRVYGPATAFGLSKKIEEQAFLYAKKIADAVDLVGTFAVEFFETEQGELCVNEIAPRVHNSGHYTQNACVTDQFENHWRAVLGLPLGVVHHQPGFAMLNLLGPDEIVIEGETPLPVPGPRTHLHWYGKREIRPGRKLGHLNGTVQSAQEVNHLLNELTKSSEDWILRLKKERTQK